MKNQSAVRAHNFWQKAFSWLAVYAAWLVAIALTGLGFLLLRSAISQWYVVLSLPPSAHKAVDRLLIFFGGALWVFLIFYLEGYLRLGIKRGTLRDRVRTTFLRLGAFTLSAGLLLWAVQWFA
jgi:hypothetical protein